jgi:drug/metabolite transporter (DMT)-like permease
LWFKLIASYCEHGIEDYSFDDQSVAHKMNDMPLGLVTTSMNTHPLRRNRATPWVVTGIGILAVSSASILIRLSNAPPLVIGAYRMVLAALLLAPWAVSRSIPEWRRLSRREWWLLVLSGLALAAHFAAWITSLSLTTVSSSVILVSTSPIFVGLASYFILHERVSWRKTLAICLALAGTVIVAMGDFSLSGRALAGDLLAIGGALAVSCYLLLGRVLRRRLSTLAYVWPCYSIAGISLLTICLITSQPILGYSLNTYVLLVLLAILPQIIGHSAFNWALAYFTPVFITIATLGEPIGASILAFFILHEIPTTVTLFGGAVTLVGIILASIDEHVISDQKGSVLGSSS